MLSINKKSQKVSYLIIRHANEVSKAGFVFDLFLISRHANEVSEAGFVFDLFLILPLPLEACTRCISGTAWS